MMRAPTIATLLLALCVGGAAAHGGGKKYYDGSAGGKGSKGGKHAWRRDACKGRSCKAMSDLLPTLAFADGEGPVVECTCADYDAGVCFAPGCSPCASSCFEGAPNGKQLAKMAGPFGTGLLCSSDCLPCCQAPDDPDLYEGSTCSLPEGGCGSS